jgi:hypothetical protein
VDSTLERARPTAESALGIVAGFWPLFLILAMGTAFLWGAALHSSP